MLPGSHCTHVCGDLDVIRILSANIACDDPGGSLDSPSGWEEGCTGAVEIGPELHILLDKQNIFSSCCSSENSNFSPARDCL